MIDPSAKISPAVRIFSGQVLCRSSEKLASFCVEAAFIGTSL
jgi:hypothetical protein